MDTLSNKQAIAQCVLDLAKGYERKTGNSTDSTISYTEISSIGLWLCSENKVLFNLDYQGKGIWTGTGTINFTQESWGKDQLYKVAHLTLHQIHLIVM